MSKPDSTGDNSTTNAKTEAEIFVAEGVFPEAAAVFTARFTPLEETKNSACVVLDTNTLLLPYSTGSKTLSEIKTTYEKLIEQKRLLIPAQVAREFANNRVRKIAELHQKLTNRQSQQQAFRQDDYPILESVGEYQTLQTVGKNLDTLAKEYHKALGDLIDKVESWEWNDPISLLYHELFRSEIVISAKKSNEEIRKCHVDRLSLKIPPGYKDGAKDDEGIGDFLIWQTILEIGEAYGASVIFVTGEKKADWWHNSNKRQLYPRFELVDEFRRASRGQSFHIITFSRLLEMFGASATAVAEIRKEETTAPVSRRHLLPEVIRAKRAVRAWFGLLGFSISASGDSAMSFFAVKGDRAFAVAVVYIRDDGWQERLRNRIGILQRMQLPSPAMIVVVSRSVPMCREALELLAGLAGPVSYSVGTLVHNSVFEVMWSQLI